ncbi:pyruvate kinase [Butyrivibrio sp. WCD3002]|uniref:pyruvate kinase n=1 Tax=Butyrivibrio sp. WCD3002 TaxID=1280676 RepID=UPI0004119D0C|nr:pyruvate kinase [Butyrivibrio sp. WCD3002]
MIDIFGTLGPSCSDEATLKAMFEAGMTGVRLNLSHSMLADNLDTINMVKSAAEKVGVKPLILVDIQGPELRIGDLETELQLSEGQEIVIGKNGIPVDFRIFENIHPGIELKFDDGKLAAVVSSCSDDYALATVKRGGVLKSRKSIASDDFDIEMPTLTEEDHINIKCAAENGITGIMQPFVRGREDVATLRNELHHCGADDIRIYAKIEDRRGIDKLDTIIEESDEIIIARGDLGNAVPLYDLPGVQKDIAGRCTEIGKPFMVVTQMLASMEHSPVPTRAEVSDIFNAVLDGASSVMVTGETAVGEYPVEVIRYMKKTIESAEKYKNKL